MEANGSIGKRLIAKQMLEKLADDMKKNKTVSEEGGAEIGPGC